ncbi:MAG TPA: NEW3 domain-containing protein [Candidatus Thermoplasmatota archaeon]|nr:NEW3 domain-containing protein [Candidatus Thermoplasmatota archaeon]
MTPRRLLLLLALLLLALPAPQPALAQAEGPFTVLALERSGDRLEVTLRSATDLRDVVVRLTSDGAVAGLPDWERARWHRGDVASSNFTLLEDVDVAAIAYSAEEVGTGDMVSGSIPIVVPAAGFDEPLTVVEVARTRDALVVALRATENLTDVVVRLTEDDAIVGLPEWRRESWDEDERAAWSFELLHDLTRAALDWEALDAHGEPRSGTLAVAVPAAPTSDGDGTRLMVTTALLQGTTATITVTNYGDEAARDLVVSIEDRDERRIATPLTALVASLAPGARASPQFTLPENVVDVVVVLDHANATTRTALTLQRAGVGNGTDTGGPNVTLSTDLPFREVDLGRSADFSVQVRNNGAPALVQLRADGLPQGYSARFFVGGSAVPSLYLDRNQTRQATLTVTVPSARTEVDRTADFAVVASVNGTETQRLKMGVAVRGVGQLEVSSAESEAPLTPGGTATFQVVVKNSGSAPVFNVELDSRRPYGWTVRVEPRRLDRLDPGATSAVSVEVRAPDVIGGGRYTVDVAAKADDLTSRYVPLAMSIDEPSGGGGWVWGVMLVAIAGILGFAAWWKWRG